MLCQMEKQINKHTLNNSNKIYPDHYNMFSYYRSCHYTERVIDLSI